MTAVDERRRRVEVPLGDGLPPAAYETWRVGQCSIHESDLVIVGLIVYLPAPEGVLLHPELTFGSRLVVCGQELSPSWGEFTSKAKRARAIEQNFTGSTWGAARKCGVDWADRELGKLVEAVESRRKALCEAEDEYDVVAEVATDGGVRKLRFDAGNAS